MRLPYVLELPCNQCFNCGRKTSVKKYHLPESIWRSYLSNYSSPKLCVLFPISFYVNLFRLSCFRLLRILCKFLFLLLPKTFENSKNHISVVALLFRELNEKISPDRGPNFSIKDFLFFSQSLRERKSTFFQISFKLCFTIVMDYCYWEIGGRGPNKLSCHCVIPRRAATLLDPFQTNVPFLYPVKTSENRQFSDVFRRERCSEMG